jgi:hypothetical protein
MSVIRVYADTSVFGGPFDEEFQTASSTFFDQVRNGRFQLVTSALVQEEVEPAPHRSVSFSTSFSILLMWSMFRRRLLV